MQLKDYQVFMLGNFKVTVLGPIRTSMFNILLPEVSLQIASQTTSIYSAAVPGTNWHALSISSYLIVSMRLPFILLMLYFLTIHLPKIGRTSSTSDKRYDWCLVVLLKRFQPADAATITRMRIKTIAIQSQPVRVKDGSVWSAFSQSLQKKTSIPKTEAPITLLICPVIGSITHFLRKFRIFFMAVNTTTADSLCQIDILLISFMR